MQQEVQHRDYRIVQVTPGQIARELKCSSVAEAEERCSMGGMKLPVVYIVRDEFDDNPMPLPGMWFESPLTAKAAIDIHLYDEGYQRTFWPNYHDVFIAMRSCPQLLRAFQELHRQAREICEDGLVEQDDFAHTVRERLARVFTGMEFNVKT